MSLFSSDWYVTHSTTVNILKNYSEVLVLLKIVHWGVDLFIADTAFEWLLISDVSITF